MTHDHYRGFALARQRRHEVVDDPCVLCIQLTRRFVCEEQARAVRNGCANRDPLLFTSRQFSGTRIGFLSKPHPLEELDCAALHDGSRCPQKSEAKTDDLLRGKLWREKAGVMLVDITDVASAIAGKLASAQLGDLLFKYTHAPRGWQIEPREQAQERCLFRIRWADHDHDLVLGNRERESLERGGVAFGSRMTRKTSVRLIAATSLPRATNGSSPPKPLPGDDHRHNDRDENEQPDRSQKK